MIGYDSRIALGRLWRKISQRIGLDVELLNAPAEREELQGAETVTGPPSIVLAGQFERVRACAFGRDIAEEIAEVQGAPREVEPTLRYVLHDVLVDRGVIYRGRRQKLFNPELPLTRSRPQWVEHDEAVVRSSLVGTYYFGHWLRDDCATHLLAAREGAPMSMPTPPWPDCAEYLALLGQHYAILDRAHVRRLILYHDIGQNTHKTERLRALRARTVMKRTSPGDGRIVYLMRGAGGSQRRLVNEAEIAKTLAAQGVIVVKAEAAAMSELFKKLAGARIIISVEGSQLSHALYTLGDAGGLLVIQPPDRFFNSHMDWARALGMSYGIVVGEQCDGGFRLPVHDLLHTIDRLEARLA